MYAAIHQGCGGVLGFYHGDPFKSVVSSEFFRQNGSNPPAGSGFREVCPKCKATLSGLKEITWKHTTPPPVPADNEQGLSDWALMQPHEDDD